MIFSHELDRLAAFIVDDILKMTDQEIMQEIIEDGEDINQIVHDTRNIFDRALINIKKKTSNETI